MPIYKQPDQSSNLRETTFTIGQHNSKMLSKIRFRSRLGFIICILKIQLHHLLLTSSVGSHLILYFRINEDRWHWQNT